MAAAEALDLYIYIKAEMRLRSCFAGTSPILVNELCEPIMMSQRMQRYSSNL